MFNIGLRTVRMWEFPKVIEEGTHFLLRFTDRAGLLEFAFTQR